MELDVEQQKSRLQTKKAELEQSIANLTEAHPKVVSSTEANDPPGDSEDRATDMLETVGEQSIEVNQRALLTLVDRALQRLADGTYGLCQQCGQPIPLKRLEALPWAERDVRCEAELEQRYRERDDVVYGQAETK